MYYRESCNCVVNLSHFTVKAFCRKKRIYLSNLLTKLNFVTLKLYFKKYFMFLTRISNNPYLHSDCAEKDVVKKQRNLIFSSYAKVLIAQILT